MERNIRTSLTSLVVLLLGLFGTVCTSHIDVATLRYRSLGGGEDFGKIQFQLAREQGNYPAIHGESIFCIDSAYPNNIYCDVRALFQDEDEDIQEIHAIALEFVRTGKNATRCSIDFNPESFPLSFQRQRLSCSSGDSFPSIPRVGDMEKMMISTRRSGNPALVCENYFVKDGDFRIPVTEGLSSVSLRIIRFSKSKVSCSFPILKPLWSE